MIDKANAVETVQRKLDDLPVGHCIDLRTYKRNRSVLIIRKPGDVFQIVQDGFDQATFEVKAPKLRKALTKLLKREFPRSNKIRLYDLGSYSPEVRSLDRKRL